MRASIPIFDEEIHVYVVILSFLSAIWLSHSQLWATLKKAALLTKC